MFPAVILNAAEDKVPARVNKPFVVNYHRKDYKGDHQNWSVDVSQNGLLYFGNNAGLIEFDGSNWFRYQIAENMVVRSVAVGTDGKIYTGAYEEFGFWVQNEFGLLSYHSLSDSIDPASMHNDEIWRIIPLHDRVYFQSFSSIYIYDGSKVSVIKPESSVVLLQQAGNRLYIHMVDRGLYELKNDRLIFIGGSGFLANEEVRVVLHFGEDSLLVGSSSSGLYLYDGVSFVRWNVPANMEVTTAEINVGLAMDQFFVIGTIVNGIYFIGLDGQIIYHINAENFLPNNTVLALRQDNRGNVWAGLDQGIAFLQLDNPLDLHLYPGSRLGSVYAAALYGSYLWIGTNQGLFRFVRSSENEFADPVMVPGSHGQVWDLKTIDGQLLMGHTNGTYRVGETGEMHKISEINGGYEIKKISIDSKEYLVQSTYTNLVVYEKIAGLWKFHHTIEGFLEPVSQFEIDHFGNIWAVHNNRGVFQVKLDETLGHIISIRFFGKAQGFPNDWGLHVARVENRIVFPTGQEMYTFDDLNDTIIPYLPLNDQLGEFKRSRQVISVDRNRYWCIMDQKACLFSIDNNKATRLFQYDFELHGVNFITNYPNIVHIEDSTYLFCLDNGFARLHENVFSAGTDSIPLIMRRAKAINNRGKGKNLPLDLSASAHVLPSSYRSLVFSYSSPGSSPYPQYRIRLRGLEEEWGGWENQSFVEYSRLKYGHYLFQVESKNIKAEQGSRLEYAVVIKSPWFASSYAFVFYGLFTLAFIVFMRWSFLRRLAHQTRKLEERNAEKVKQEKLLAEQNIIRLKNENLEKELSFINKQLANYTFNIIRRNQTLIKIREEIQKHRREAVENYPFQFLQRLLKLVEKNLSSEDDWKVFESHFDAAHQDFLKRLIHTFPDLTPSDLRLCAYLRINLSSKEIAPLLNITVRGVEIRRYRLRKRLGMKTEENLAEFILGY